MFIRNTDSIPLASNYKLVKNDFDLNLQKEIEERFKSKLYFRFVLNLIGERTIPYQQVLNLKHNFYYWQRNFYGDNFDFHVKEEQELGMPFDIKNQNWIKLLDPLIKFSKENHIEIKAYFEPHEVILLNSIERIMTAIKQKRK